jgi:hypothetical protein
MEVESHRVQGPEVLVAAVDRARRGCPALISRQRSDESGWKNFYGRRPSQRNNDTAIDVARAEAVAPWL